MSASLSPTSEPTSGVPSRTTTDARGAAPLTTWGAALALAALGTAILWKSSIGINWPLWIAGVVSALVLSARERFGTVGAPFVVATSWALVLALFAAITADEVRITMLILATLVLLAIALVTAGQRSLDVLLARIAIPAPFTALKLTVVGFITEITEGSRISHSARAGAIARAALITIPVVVVLILLLAEADPLFAAMRNAIEHLVPDDVLAQLIFFACLLVVTLGALGGVTRAETHALAAASSPRRTLGALERRVLLASLATIMWTFVISAYVSLTRDPASKAGSGITYAEYVHNGFAQLSIAATIVIGIVLVTRRSWLAADTLARRLALAAIAGVIGMVAIAFMRVVGYERVYGFTILRLYAQAYMVVLACMGALLAREISRRTVSVRFAFHSATAALGVLTCCVAWNTDGWIVRHNVERYLSTGKLDTYYITAHLSDDATPALVDSVHLLREPERSEVTRFLRRTDIRNRREPREWFSWNLRASSSAKAARAFHANDILGAEQVAGW